jgi:thiamine biosynthesis lipoprotein
VTETLASTIFPALGSDAVLVVADSEALAEADDLLREEIDAIDRACSRFREDSELVTLNRAAGRELEVSQLLLEAIEVALAAALSTGGLVDPTIGRSLRLAGYDRDFALVQALPGRPARFVPASGWRRIEVDHPRSTVFIPAGTELDLGATAKALAADRSACRIAGATGTGVLVSLGGDVAVSGNAPAGGWPLRIADDRGAAITGDGPTVSISSGGLATSGVASRRWQSAEGELHHVLDPATGRPVDTPWRTVTVAAPTCVEANVASTASLLLGDRAPAWLAERGLPARLVSRAGRLVGVAGWPLEEAA